MASAAGLATDALNSTLKRMAAGVYSRRMTIQYLMLGVQAGLLLAPSARAAETLGRSLLLGRVADSTISVDRCRLTADHRMTDAESWAPVVTDLVSTHAHRDDAAAGVNPVALFVVGPLPPGSNRGGQ
jgi:hypothetical protein